MARRKFGSVGSKNGRSWWARYTRNGAWHTPGHTFSTEQAAWAWLRGEQRLIDRDEWTPPAERRAASEAQQAAEELADSTTLDRYAREWIAKRVTRKGGPLHPATRETYHRYLNGILAPLGSRPVVKITPADVKRWYDAAAATPPLRHKAYAFMKSVMKTAVEVDELIDRNPCRVENATRKPRPKHDTAAVVKWLNHERVLELAGLVQPRDRLLVLLAAYCCVRTGEAWALRRSDVEFGVGTDGLPFGWLTVERGISTHDRQRHEGQTKTGDKGNRVVPIPPHLVAEVESHLTAWAEPGAHGLLFPSTNPTKAFRTADQVNGNVDGPRRPGYGWYHARQVAGCPTAHLHDLRHWGATLWDEAGTPAGLRIAIMGHAQPGMTGHYTHPDTAKASPYALRVSQLAGWTPMLAAVPQTPASPLAAVLAAMDADTLASTLATLDATQLADVVPHLTPERMAVVVAALAGKRPNLQLAEGSSR